MKLTIRSNSYRDIELPIDRNVIQTFSTDDDDRGITVTTDDTFIPMLLKEVETAIKINEMMSKCSFMQTDIY